MKKLVFIFIFCCFSLIVLAQPKGHPHHERHYAKVETIETEELRIEIINPHSQESFSQFAAKIFNKTEDYILLKKHEITFSSDENGYGDKNPPEGIWFIEPKGDITRTFKVQGGVGCKVSKIDVVMNGFSRALTEGKPVETVEFKFKPEKNSMMIGPFAVTVKKWRLNTKELSADFKMRYRGEAVGIVTEPNIKIRTESGTILENKRANEKPFVLVPMKTRTATVVRPFEKGQVGKGESVYVVWEAALSEAEGIPIEVPGFTLTYDSDKTKKENK